MGTDFQTGCIPRQRLGVRWPSTALWAPHRLHLRRQRVRLGHDPALLGQHRRCDIFVATYPHEAFAEGATEFNELLPEIELQTQLILGSAGASAAKKLAAASLHTAACEIMGAVASYAKDIADAELAAQVAYTESGVTKGKTSAVVARCKIIHAAATENLAALAKYGVTAAKLTAFKKKIDAFDKLKVAPRDSVITRRAAGEMQEQLVRSAVGILRDKLDRLVVQFKAVNPTFYGEYFAARVIVDMRGGNASNTDVQSKGTATPTPVPTPA